jgi:hypothetical protein
MGHSDCAFKSASTMPSETNWESIIASYKEKISKLTHDVDAFKKELVAEQ